jgi:hypothetical protein
MCNGMCHSAWEEVNGVGQRQCDGGEPCTITAFADL